jgi:phosphatidylinositol glycan class V
MAVIAKKEADIGLSRRNGDVTRLFLVFIAWKTLLILLATCSPGPGYDTSGLIALTEEDHARSSIQPSSLIDRLALSHLRWDALYFVKAAQRGYLYEQEWAFSRVYSFILQTVKNCRSLCKILIPDHVLSCM